jgi:Fur family ferric uptake transcriptional regulator
VGSAQALAEPQIQALLQDNGLRVTVARLLLVKAFAELGHATAERLLVTAEPSLAGLSMSTVYRTLEGLLDRGIVQHAQLGSASASYYLSSTADHAHLVCTSCRRVTPYAGTALARLADAIAIEHGFTPTPATSPCRACAVPCRPGPPTQQSWAPASARSPERPTTRSVRQRPRLEGTRPSRRLDCESTRIHCRGQPLSEQRTSFTRARGRTAGR